MKQGQLLINGHYRKQRVTGVQRYANEIIRHWKKNKIDYEWISPPKAIGSDSLRQLWMQAVMPFKTPKDQLLWSPTNVGPVFCENQVLTLHDIADQLHPEWFNNRYVQWRKLILPPLLKKVRRIITVSNYSKRTIESHYPQTEGKIEVIYNGVEIDHFYPRGAPEVKQLKNDLDLRKPYILSVGSLDVRKNIKGLIKAWEKLPEVIRKKIDLVITGESAQKFAFTLDQSPSESIRFTGYLQEADLPALYSGAKIFVYPSLFEGFGLPILEAMACNTPVITSATTSLGELAADKAMTIDDPATSEAITAAIEKMLDSQELQDSYSRGGQAYAQTFSWSDSAKKTYTILKQCMA